jgi:hypothetical protein
MKELIGILGIGLLFLNNCSNTPINEQLIKTTLSQKDLNNEELITRFNHFDFSELFMKNDTQILGFIGDNYQRIQIKYLSIIKKHENPNIYYVFGRSRVKSNICSFLGEIEVKHVRKIDNSENQKFIKEFIRLKDLESVKRYSKEEYVLLALYQFFEDPKIGSSGIFKGILELNFYFENETIFYNDLDFGSSDIYSNNQCTGTWTEYGSTNSKTCNWGEFRIPHSGDLDIGSGEVSINKKYLKNGWQTYYDAFLLGDSVALKEERRKWW